MSVHAEACAFFRMIDLFDAEGHPFILRSRQELREGFKAYVELLRERVARSELLPNSAAKEQTFVMRILAAVSDDDAFTHGVNLLRIQKGATNHTQPPSEAAQGQFLALAECVFSGLSALVLEHRPYPCAIAVPKWLGAKNDLLWVFPSTKWCMPPHEIARRESLGRALWAYDFENGRVATVAEISHRFIVDPRKNRKENVARNFISTAEQTIELANADRNHRCRLNAAMSAHNAFIVLFLAHTGMNWASVMSLSWGEDPPEIGVERQGFRTVKHRAMGRTVSFEIQSIFLTSFKRFLQVRNYLLQGRTFDKLFLAAGRSAKRIGPLKRQTLRSIVDSLMGIDPTLTRIMSKEWRAGKSDFLIRNVDPAMAAIVLQNTEYTVLQAYAEGSPTVQAEEMSNFFSSLESVVIDSGVVLQDAKSVAVGVCTAFGKPRISSGSPVKADCKAMEGCLFCDKLRVHADERDTRKLVSCRFCIAKVTQMVSGDCEAEKALEAIHERLNELLNDVDAREPGIVARIEAEVLEGELDKYWAAKIELLFNLGVVS